MANPLVSEIRSKYIHDLIESGHPVIFIGESEGEPAVASSTQNTVNTPSAATDGNAATRWESVQSVDPQWIYVDLGQPMEINRVKLTWETAYASAYQIQVSKDAVNWTSIYSTTTSAGGVNDLTGLNGYGRYVRIYGIARGSAFGYSLWEFEVYGKPVESYTRSALSLATHNWYIVAMDAFGNRKQSTSTLSPPK